LKIFRIVYFSCQLFVFSIFLFLINHQLTIIIKYLWTLSNFNQNHSNWMSFKLKDWFLLIFSLLFLKVKWKLSSVNKPYYSSLYFKILKIFYNQIKNSIIIVPFLKNYFLKMMKIIIRIHIITIEISKTLVPCMRNQYIFSIYYQKGYCYSYHKIHSYQGINPIIINKHQYLFLNSFFFLRHLSSIHWVIFWFSYHKKKVEANEIRKRCH